MSDPMRNAGVTARPSPQAAGNSHRVSAWMLTACGVWLVGLGFYFIVLRPPLLPEDPRFMGTTLEQIRTSVPGLEAWLQKVFTVMGGFMAGAGVPWAVGFSGVLTVLLMSATNFALQSDFRWLLLLPALVWFAGLVVYLANHGATSVGHDRGHGGVD